MLVLGTKYFGGILNWIFLIRSLVVLFLGETLPFVWLALLFSVCSVVSQGRRPSSDWVVSYFLLQETWRGLFLARRLLGITWLTYIRLFFKLGLPPLHLWVVLILESCGRVFTWILTMSKFTPGIILILIMREDLVVPFFVSFLVRNILIASTSSVKLILLFRGGRNISWVFLVRLVDLSSSMIVLITYLLGSYLIYDRNPWEDSVNWETVFYISGIPPSPLFFLKTTGLIQGVGFFSGLLMLYCTIFRVLTYLWLVLWMLMSSLTSTENSGLGYSTFVVYLIFLVLMFLPV